MRKNKCVRGSQHFVLRFLRFLRFLRRREGQNTYARIQQNLPQVDNTPCTLPLSVSLIQVALVIRGGYVPQKYREYQNRDYQVQ
jgi:hypothetical protein